MTVDWLGRTWNLMPQDRRRLTPLLKRVFVDWPQDRRLDAASFFDAYLRNVRSRRESIAIIDRTVATLSPTKGQRKMLVRRLHAIANQRIQETGGVAVPDVSGRRHRLAEAGEDTLLAELLWIETAYGWRVEDAARHILTRPGVRRHLEPWLSAVAPGVLLEDSVADDAVDALTALLVGEARTGKELPDDFDEISDAPAPDWEDAVTGPSDTPQSLLTQWHATVDALLDAVQGLVPGAPEGIDAIRCLLERLASTDDDLRRLAEQEHLSAERTARARNAVTGLVPQAPKTLTTVVSEAAERCALVRGLQDEELARILGTVNVCENAFRHYAAASEERGRRRSALVALEDDASPEAVDELTVAFQQANDDLRAAESSAWTAAQVLDDLLVALVEAADDARDAGESDAAPGTADLASDDGSLEAEEAGVEDAAPGEVYVVDVLPEPNVTASVDAQDGARLEQEGDWEDADPSEEAAGTACKARPLNPGMPDTREEDLSVDETAGPLGPLGEDEWQPGAETPQDDELGARLTDAFVRLIDRGELGLAYHLVRAAEAGGASLDGVLPSASATALCVVGRSVRTSGSAASLYSASLVETLLGACALHQTASMASQATILLTLAGGLRPALFAADSGARVLVGQLPLGSELAFLHDLRQPIVSLDEKGYYASPAALSRGIDRDRALANRKAAAEALDLWLTTVRKASIVYAPATQVWHHFLEPSGVLGSVVELVIAGEKAAADAVRAFMTDYGNDSSVAELINRTFRELNPGIKKTIEARALQRLLSHWRDARAKLGDWLDAWVTLSDVTASSSSHQDEEVRARLSATITKVSPRLDALATHASILGASARALRTVVNDIRRMLNAEDDVVTLALPEQALHADLLKLPGLDYAGGWVPASLDPDLLLEPILAYAEGDGVTWEQAFHDRVAEHNHLATEHVIRVLSRLGGEGAVQTLWDVRSQDIDAARITLKTRLEAVRRRIDRALRLDSSGDLALSELLDRLETVDPVELPRDGMGGFVAAGGVVADFPAAFRLLTTAEHTMASVENDLVDRYRARLDRLSLSGKEETVQRLRRLLTPDGLVSLSDALELLEEGQELPPDDGGRDAFDTFFPAFTDALEAGAVRLVDVQRAVKLGSDVGPLPYSTLVSERREDVRQLLGAWANVKATGIRNSRDMPQHLKHVFEGLGFLAVRIGEDSARATSARSRAFTLTTAPIADQTVCPVPAFGSKAAGCYTVTLHDVSESEQEILTAVPSGDASAHIAIYLGRLSTERRRAFALAAHEGRRSVLLIEEGLLFFLSLQSLRLPALFTCGLPFGCCDPYSLIAGDVPIEMFYGRSREIEEVWSPDGPCLIYGGRQLGKSALLQHVRKKFHAPERDHVVRVHDFRQIGRSEPLEQIWPKLAADLSEQRVLEKGDGSAKTVIAGIEAWLDCDARRRLLLLLDETDKFLVGDAGNDFVNVMLFKGLMERTRRRFKVVFAGLHDVQRVASTVNSPLAHFGQALCIGPLYGRDLAAAQQLVTRPLAAVGFRFPDDSGLPHRILSDVNFYPSLVQVVGKQLVRQLQQGGYRRADGPRYVVTARQVEEAFEGREMRDLLVERFRMTLQLDKRYRLIALILTLQAMDDRGRIVDGYSTAWIREQAMHWWAKGLSDAGLELFDALLREMEGLGVLRRAKNGWRLRSTKIAAMMGTPETIEHELLAFSDHEAELEYAPGAYHRAIGGNPLRPSPLTQRQEARLRDPELPVQVVFGSSAQGLDDVRVALADAHEGVPPKFVDKIRNERELGTVCRRHATSAEPGLLVIASTVPWTSGWVSGVAQLIHGERLKVRILFLGNPQQAFNWMVANRRPADERLVGVHVLDLWSDKALQLWLNDASLDHLDVPEERLNILRETGGLTKAIAAFGVEVRDLSPGHEERRRNWLGTASGRSVVSAQSLGILPGVVEFLTALSLDTVGFSREDLRTAPDVYGITPPGPIDSVIAWIEAMGLLRQQGADRWMVSGPARAALASLG